MRTVSCAVLLACFLGCLAGAWAQSAGLEILPNSENQTKPIGRSMLLTCKPNVTNKNLISQLRWTDPNGREVPFKNPTLLKPHIFVDWLPPPGEKVLTLMIPELREADTGTYTCSALYSNTERLSKSVHVRTIMPITWDDAPEEQYPTVNETFKIRCRVSANPPAIVNWMRDGHIVETGDRYVVEQDGLTILNVTEMDDGTYTCRAIVIATGEMALRPIRVEVHTPPQMSGALPPKLEAIEGTDFTAKCAASGKPVPRYTWIRVDTARDLTKDGDRVSADVLLGELRIREVRPEDAANYSCTAQNAAGTATATVEVTVVVRPRIGRFDNISVASGKDSEAVLECHATGSPLPAVTFRKLSNPNRYINGIQPTEDRITVDGVDSPDGRTRIGKLIISNVLRSDDGLYECIATNKGGEVKKNGHLMVEFKPSFADTPQKEVWGWEQHAVNLTCLAHSIPNATISWHFNGADLFRGREGQELQQTGYTLFGSGPRSTLQVVPFNRKMYGNYKCTATNKHGTAVHEIMLREARVPSAVLQVKMDVMTATTVTFKFFGPGNDGGLPTKNYAVQYKQDSQGWEEALNRTWPVDSPYILENLKPQTRYNFRFAAQNEVGFGPWSSQQTHTTPRISAPEEPRLLGLPLSATSGNENEVVVSPYPNRYELRWQVPADNGEPITHYSVKSCPVEKYDTEWRLLPYPCQEHKLEGQATTFQLESLQPDTHYKVEVRATNAIGNSVPGQIIVRTVKDPSQMPGIANVEDGSEGQMSSAAIVVLVVAALLLALLVVDLVCCLVWRAGLIAALCHRCCSAAKTDDSDAKIASLYSWRFPLPYCSNKEDPAVLVPAKMQQATVKIPVIEEKEPLRDGKEPVPIIKERVKRETAVDFDVKKSVSRTSFVGKDSAV
ncbi:fasciclin-2 isoform X2 [Schistocerca gregaria]|uniref:fasciclin-2 isoform X2 n=1 Tax=Schistocerca gregaria TaxID=7010 RepID=UPI00211E83FF|nr:fasciclin-2 isoform X2 [Schistocerca gregaria]